ncbi:MAG TPA: RNA polymerase sigma factor [Mucilaginibacter sp.]
MTDEALMICIKNDDLEKAGLLYERYKIRLFKYFVYRTFNDQEASKDNVQQVFLRVIKYRKSFKDDGDFKVWLYSIAANVKKKEFISQQQRNNALSAYTVDNSYVTENDNYKLIHEILQRMPVQYREVLTMSKFWGMKYEEIALAQQCSVGVIKTRVYRAVQILRNAYFKLI